MDLRAPLRRPARLPSQTTDSSPEEWSKASSNLNAAPGAPRKSSESQETPDYDRACEYFLDLVSHGELQFLLHDEEQWRKLAEEANLSRAEEDALYKVLSCFETDRNMKEDDTLQQDQEQLLLDAFPGMIKEIEERIRKLHALADKVAKTHRDCTISQVVAASAGVVSGVLSICGLSLAPVTAGVSLGLTAAGIGLGAASAVTSVSTSIVDHTSKKSAKSEASTLVSMDVHVKEEVVDAVSKALKLGSTTVDVIKKSIDIEKIIFASKLVQSDPRLFASAKRLMTNGSIWGNRAGQVRKAFGGTALAMSKGARVFGLVMSGVFLLIDVIHLVYVSMHLQKGAPETCAQELREWAQELERRLEDLTWVYESLRKSADSDSLSSARGTGTVPPVNLLLLRSSAHPPSQRSLPVPSTPQPRPPRGSARPQTLCSFRSYPFGMKLTTATQTLRWETGGGGQRADERLRKGGWAESHAQRQASGPVTGTGEAGGLVCAHWVDYQ
ncbi:apolipoprotein L3-like [Tenrec ecaudatus]|uniref:apolipoprotein L3-like n=1 Tax=Tenrec ecaudatus TaxID=94439 RepID=UPI003F5A65FE